MLNEMKSLFILSFLLLANIFVSAQQTNNLPTNADDDIYDVQDNVLIKTRDGASISATIVRKKGITESLPAILFYTTYYQGSKDTVFGKKSAARGFVGVVAYSRGIRTNLDEYVPYEHDGNDVYDIVDWI